VVGTNTLTADDFTDYDVSAIDDELMHDASHGSHVGGAAPARASTPRTPTAPKTTDRDYARTCADALAHLAEWGARDRASRKASRHLRGLQFAATVQAPSGGMWAPHVMARHMQQAEARSIKAVFERRVALVQLAAWVAMRKAQDDMRNVYGRERDTCIISLLVDSTRGRDGRETCSRGCWLSYYRAGRRWMDLVQRFGGGVLAFKLPIMGIKWQVNTLITLGLLLPLLSQKTSLTLILVAAAPLQRFLLLLVPLFLSFRTGSASLPAARVSHMADFVSLSLLRWI
jgi:hypothetical protein